MKTIAALIVILLASWELEILGGIQLITLSWNFPLAGGSLADIVARTGSIILSYWHTYPSVLYNPPHYWTAAGVTDALVAFYLWLHPVWAVFSLFWPKYVRLKLGARKPSVREEEQLKTAFASLMLESLEIALPHRVLIVDGPGFRMRWIGYVLVIDRPLLHQRHLQALLAHELGHVNQEDRMARRLFAMLPTRFALVLALMALPVGIGSLLLYPMWQWYWRERIFAGDRYAVTLGQGHALIKALDELYLPLDRATRFGRWMKPVPYVETRIHRLQQAVAAYVPAI